MEMETFIRQIPKVELHVHLEGSVRPETFLKLAERHHITLPASDVAGLRSWYTFRDFDHFIEIYMAISACLRKSEDVELIAREFLLGQAEQNIVYSEVTFTPYNQLVNCGLGIHEQIDAVNRAREWGEKELGVRMGLIIDIPRERSLEAGTTVAESVIERYGDGVVALGLGGPERGNPPAKFQTAFNRVRDAGIPCILHAGETEGPSSIWNAIEVADSKRIGHGVRAIEDPRLMTYLKQTQLPLEVCPTSNVCLKVFPSLAQHSLPKLVENGLRLTINSDDPPLFNTSLVGEFIACWKTFEWDKEMIQHLLLNAIDAALLPPLEKLDMRQSFIDHLGDPLREPS